MLRDLAQELFEPMGSLEQALALVGLVPGKIQQHNMKYTMYMHMRNVIHQRKKEND